MFKFRVLAALSVMSLVLVACGGTTSPTAGGKKTFKIAFLSQGPTNSWATQMDQIARDTAKKSGQVSQLLYFDSEANADKQVTQMSDAIAAKPDLIVLIPMGKAALAGPVDRARAAGIPVVLCASGVDSNNYNAFVFHDLKKYAGQDAQWLASDQLHGKGNIVVIDGIAGNDTSETLGKSLRDVLKNFPDIHIAAQGYNDFSVSKAKQLMETFLASGKPIDGVWGSGGEATTGIVQAYLDAHKPIPPIAGATADNGFLRLAAENKFPVAGWQFPSAISAACFQVALRILNGESMQQKFFDLADLLPADVGGDYFTQDVPQFYKPQFTDAYINGSDKYLSQDELKSMQLLK